MAVLRYVNLSTDVYFVCLNHAMSTDGEEIVGLLVGEVDENRVAHVSAVVILRRSDKRKDRVEISPEQLSNASTEAERLACILKRPIRVIGWYHSHPKLTVWPSPIDVNTQDSYQFMDEGFIGVIFSVFNEDPNKKGGRIQMTCFQSQTTLIDECNVEKKRLDIPIHLVPSSCISSVCMNALIQLPRFLCQEEQLAYQMTNQVPLDYLTRLHNSSVYIKSMGQIAEVICGPLLKMLEERIINNEIKRKKLLERKRELLARLEQMRKEVDKMKLEEANVQSSAESSTSTSQFKENNDDSPKSPVELNPLPQNIKDVPESTEAFCNAVADKQPKEDKSDKQPKENKSDKQPNENKPDKQPNENKSDKQPNENKSDKEPRENKLDKEPRENELDKEPSENKLDKEPSENKLDKEPRENKLDKEPRENKLDKEPRENKLDKEPSENKLDKQPSENKLDKQPSENKFDEKPKGNASDKLPKEKKLDNVSCESGYVAQCESGDNALSKVDKCEVQKESLTKEELNSLSASESSNAEDDVSVKISNIPADNN